MADRRALGPESDQQQLLAEIARQNKVIEALMNRLERNAAGDYRTEFDELQTAVVLRGEVRRRTAALETALAENELMTRQLRESELKLLSVLNQPLVGIATSVDGKFTFLNQKLADIFGYRVDELLGADLLSLVAPADQPIVAAQLSLRPKDEAGFLDQTFRGLRKDGAEIDIELHRSVQTLGQTAIATSVMLDISKRKRAERRAEELHALLLEQSIRDALTGLYNRRHLDAALQQAFDRCRNDGLLSIVMCDIDHFKAINDRYGHPVGDHVLVLVADRIKQRCGDDDLAFRYGGEEFLIALPGRTAAMAAAWANALRADLEAEVIGPSPDRFQMTASFGVACFPQHGATHADIIDLADKALYAAKRCGRNQVRTASLEPLPDALLRRPEPPVGIAALGRR